MEKEHQIRQLLDRGFTKKEAIRLVVGQEELQMRKEVEKLYKNL